MFNKAICISLLFLLLMQVGGLSLIFKIQQCCVQHQMVKILSNDKTFFETIVLSSTDYKRATIAPHEMLLNGKMYDINSMKTIGGKVELQVVNDHGEEQIIDNIKTLASNHQQSNKEQSNFLFQLIGLLYIFPDTDSDFALQPHLLQHYFSFCEMITSNTKSVFSPPPDLV